MRRGPDWSRLSGTFRAQLSNESMPEDARSSLRDRLHTVKDELCSQDPLPVRVSKMQSATARAEASLVKKDKALFAAKQERDKARSHLDEVRSGNRSSPTISPRSVGGKFRLAEGLLHGRRCQWLAGGWILILALFQQCVLASLHRGRVYFGCSQQRSGDSWLERTSCGAHWYARATAAGRRQHRVDEAVAGGSSYPCSAEQISGPDTFHPTQDASHVLALDDLPSVDAGRQVSRSPRGAATAEPVSFCMAEATPLGT